MAALKDITKFLDELVDINSTPGDPSNNGLQVEAAESVLKAVFSVDVSRELFRRAAVANADLIFVHHGISWGAEPKRLTGLVAARFEKLFTNGISLYAAHLPLDAHPEIGHNALLADMAGVADREEFCEFADMKIGFVGRLNKIVDTATLAAIYEDKLDCEAKIYGDIKRKIGRLAVVAGGAGLDGLMDAYHAGADCYVTGEISHMMYPFIVETGVNVIQLGHYKSEIPGVKAVMDRLGAEFDIDCEFVDVPTGL